MGGKETLHFCLFPLVSCLICRFSGRKRNASAPSASLEIGKLKLPLYRIHLKYPPGLDVGGLAPMPDSQAASCPYSYHRDYRPAFRRRLTGCSPLYPKADNGTPSPTTMHSHKHDSNGGRCRPSWPLSAHQTFSPCLDIAMHIIFMQTWNRADKGLQFPALLFFIPSPFFSSLSFAFCLAHITVLACFGVLRYAT